MEDILKQFSNYLYAIGYTQDYHVLIVRFLAKYPNYKEFTYNNMMEYLAYLRSTNLRNSTLNTHIKAIRFFYKYLANSNIISQDRLESILKVKLLSVEYTKQDHVSEEELEKMVRVCIQFYDSMDIYKQRAIAYFMFFTGVRRNEMVNIKRKDIHLDSNRIKLPYAVIRIPTKNRTERIVFFPKKIVPILKDYFATEGEIDNAFNLTDSILYCYIRALNQFSPEGKNIHPHSLRHSFGQLLARKGIDIRVAQKLLGHKDIATTAIYYDPDEKVIEELYRKNIK